MNPPLNSPRARAIAGLGIIAIILLCAYWVITAYQETQNTGKIKITSNIPDTILSVSGLKPGTYLVSGTSSSKSDSAVVSIAKRQITTVALKLSDIPKLPSPDNINFQGLDALLDSGLGANQIIALKGDFFRFKTTAKQVTIDKSSIKPAPRNPNTDTSFTTNFSGSVDGAPYSVAINFTDTDTLTLILTNSQGVQVFNSALAGQKNE
jgi:hypothetical protein